MPAAPITICAYFMAMVWYDRNAPVSPVALVSCVQTNCGRVVRKEREVEILADAIFSKKDLIFLPSEPLYTLASLSVARLWHVAASRLSSI
ncbi:MAG: hypothetical protein EOO65_00815 [Methanosarcinales archaeon]|nr:MAG: hypothetical protein EOO65_00815 [Methanosarcinales archaeon]